MVSVVGERKASMIDNALELIIKRQEATIDRLPKRHSAFRVDLDNDVKEREIRLSMAKSLGFSAAKLS